MPTVILIMITFHAVLTGDFRGFFFLSGEQSERIEPQLAATLWIVSLAYGMGLRLGSGTKPHNSGIPPH
jgi:hypothetical protein